ncbi:hypothetical protein C8N25_10737 [Algoriphagus antarcticus]|uniref:Uncharacterized protein n=1 Tax=Algoriphagus antarcticus TaxID=238540 RepID=A0A3E0DW64_9BACT|nr:hypothetical protein C8N25_10737 [Algoriphagus antarcticus]
MHEARQNIEKYGKRSVELTITNAQGDPVSSSKVVINQLRISLEIYPKAVDNISAEDTILIGRVTYYEKVILSKSNSSTAENYIDQEYSGLGGD